LYDRIHDLKMPVTFIYGTNDWMDFRGALTVVDKIKSDCKIVLIDNAGHHLYLDNPDAFNSSLVDEILNQDSAAEGVFKIYQS
jgi:cardiolipin-specific phospholipase